jgi:hypothetical protein
MVYPNFTRESQVFRSTFDRLPYGCLLFLFRLDLTHVKEMRRVGLDGGKRTHHAWTHVFFIIIISTRPGSLLTRIHSLHRTAPLSLAPSLLFRLLSPSRFPFSILTTVSGRALSGRPYPSTWRLPQPRFHRSRSHAWWAHKVRECIHNKSSQDIHNTPTRTNQTRYLVCRFN